MLKSSTTSELQRYAVVQNHKSNSPISNDFDFREPIVKSAESRREIIKLQGECIIKQLVFLEVNYLKAVLLLVLLSASVIGLLLLKYYKKMRAHTFYNVLGEQEREKATHVYVLGRDKNEQISSIELIGYKTVFKKIFTFKHLKYQLQGQLWLPVALNIVDCIQQYVRDGFIKKGLSWQQISMREQYYGKNEHSVQVPNYFQYLFDTMTKPFFLFQYVVSLIYILQNVAVFGLLMIFFGFFTTSINYILLYRSYGKIKETAQKIYEITCFRDGQFKQIRNIDLVPGDLYVPDKQVPCDSILMRGDVFVDQASLTGENMPIPKFKLNESNTIKDKRHWIYQGSNIQTKKDNTLAMAVNVGFASRRGRIIRKILTKSPHQPQFFKRLIYFLIELLLVSIVIYGATFAMMLKLNIDSIMIVFRFLDFITYSFPAPFPIFFNLCYSFCLVRLNRDGIIGTEPQKTVQTSRIKTVCFDKTGTLTDNIMQIQSIYQMKNAADKHDITDHLKSNPLSLFIFASCNSVQLIHNQYKGDQIDLRMFLHTSAKFQQSQDVAVVRKVIVDGQTLQILKINQYESQFQSMSVLVKVVGSGKYYLFVKGSPEMIHKCSVFKFVGYDIFIKKLSLEGFRSISFGYRQVRPDEVYKYLQMERNQCLNGITLLGVTTFVNQLKADALSTLRTLSEAQITSKIITGDNIFLGIQTAMQTGMIRPGTKVIVVEGHKYNITDNSAEVTVLSRTPQQQFTQQNYKIQNFKFYNDNDQIYAIDNDFIKLKPNQFLHQKIVVFARISPENKALIVRKHKQLIDQKIKQLGFWNKIVGECHTKVAMVGDGANDLIAIKEADVGVAISSTDAIYSASFAVQNLQQIIQLVREGKNTERQIVDMTQYLCITQFLSIILTVILTPDASYFTSMQLIYKNFANTLLLTLFIGLSRPAATLTKHFPNTNFMGLQNHLVFWVNLTIYSIGLVCAYQYYIATNDFIPNPNPDVTFSSGWNGVNKSSTACFLIDNVIYILLPYCIYRSAPWKQSIWKNIPITVLILVNVVAILLIYFFTAWLSFLDLLPIDRREAGVMLIIICMTMVVSFIFGKIIEKMALHQKNQQNQHQSMLSGESQNMGKSSLQNK